MQPLSGMQAKYFRKQPYYSQLPDTRPKFDTSERTLQTKIDVQFPTPMVIVSLLVGVGTCACAVVSTMSVTWNVKAASSHCTPTMWVHGWKYTSETHGSKCTPQITRRLTRLRETIKSHEILFVILIKSKWTLARLERSTEITTNPQVEKMPFTPQFRIILNLTRLSDGNMLLWSLRSQTMYFKQQASNRTKTSESIEREDKSTKHSGWSRNGIFPKYGK